jgi:hypothetical protein
MDKEPTRTIEDLQQENEQLISVIDAMTAGVSGMFLCMVQQNWRDSEGKLVSEHNCMKSLRLPMLRSMAVSVCRMVPDRRATVLKDLC